MRVAAESQETPRGRGRNTPQPTPSLMAGESSRQAARRTVEKRAMAEASKKREGAMEKQHAAAAVGDANPRAAVRETKPPATATAQQECFDRNPAVECAAWAAEGECSRNPVFMRVHCRKSCHLCVDSHKAPAAIEEVQSPAKAAAAAAAAAPCEDKSTSCAAWTKAGECQRNRKFMHAECRSSCDLCALPAEPQRPGLMSRIPAEPQTPSAEQEAKLRRHLEASKKLAASSPPKPDGAEQQAATPPNVSCVDSNTLCAEWAKAGECPRNAAFMRANCPLSCDLCGEGLFQKLPLAA